MDNLYRTVVNCVDLIASFSSCTFPCQWRHKRVFPLHFLLKIHKYVNYIRYIHSEQRNQISVSNSFPSKDGYMCSRYSRGAWCRYVLCVQGCLSKSREDIVWSHVRSVQMYFLMSVFHVSRRIIYFRFHVSVLLLYFATLFTSKITVLKLTNNHDPDIYSLKS